jgi:hypothetical protein
MAGSIWWSKMLTSWNLASRKENVTRVLQYSPNDLKPSSRPDSLKVPAPPIVPWSGDQAFHNIALQRHFRSKL